jgi:hypothetical protein
MRRQTGCGRLPDFTNGCFVEAKHENVEPERRAASEKLDRRVWVDSTYWISVWIAAIGNADVIPDKAKGQPRRISRHCLILLVGPQGLEPWTKGL